MSLSCECFMIKNTIYALRSICKPSSSNFKATTHAASAYTAQALIHQYSTVVYINNTHTAQAKHLKQQANSTICWAHVNKTCSISILHTYSFRKSFTIEIFRELDTSESNLQYFVLNCFTLQNETALHFLFIYLGSYLMFFS